MKKNNFALLHLIGTLFVIIGHLYVFIGSEVPKAFASEVHGIGVEILFIVSGFLTTSSWLRSKDRVITYLKKRVLRIYPSLAVCLVVTVAFCWFITTEKSIWYWRGVWIYLRDNMIMSPCFYLPGVFSDIPYPNVVNGSLWTLPIELMCFLILPILCIGKNKRSVSGQLIVIAIGMTIIQWILYNESIQGHNHQLILWGTDWLRAVRLEAFFIWGSAYASIRHYESNCFEKRIRVEIATILILVMACIGGKCPDIIRYFTLPYVVIALGCASPINCDFFNRHEYTYGLYLYAFPVSEFWIWLCQNVLKIKMPFICLFGGVLSTTLVFAILNKKLIEEPIGKLMKRNVLHRDCSHFPKSIDCNGD